MTSDCQTPDAGDTLFEAFIEQVKQVLEHLYDFAYLQQHPLARIYDSQSDLSTKTAGRQLRHELIKGIESLKPNSNAHFRAPDARLYNVLHLYYVENLTIQEAAIELGLSDRQAYRDLRRGQESVAACAWDNRLPLTTHPHLPTQDFSLESEVARLKLHIRSVNIHAVIEQATHAVDRLASQQAVDIVSTDSATPLIVSTDPALAHQIIVTLLSYAVQHMYKGVLSVSSKSDGGVMTLTLRYRAKNEAELVTLDDSPIMKLAQRLQWTLTADGSPEQNHQIVLQMASRSTTILVIDDNQGWIELIERFLEGYACRVVALNGSGETLHKIQELSPNAIILDVMMPEQDGWELLQRLRTQPETRNVPIIVCTAFDDAQLAYSLGASAFVSKPASQEKILAALKQLNIL